MSSSRTAPPHITDRRRRLGTAAVAVALLAGSAACGSAADTETRADEATAVDSTGALVVGEVGLWDGNIVHDIEIEFDEDAYDAMIATYEATEEKDWIAATVTIDDITYDDVGLRLKGNSSLRGVTAATAGNPEDLPWLIRLDKFVDGQTHQGHTDIVIRSNSTETAINEAVAVELLGEAGLATQKAVAATLRVNGGDTELRLAMQHPDEIWEDENFGADSYSLYKAESTGDYSYRGDDPDSYVDVFDVEAGDDDLDPLIDFLEFVNEADDATFSDQLAERLDVEAFATYLAFQDLVDNFDDIDGPGNNSYLHYDAGAEMFTVVNWDLNLAFGTANAADVGGRAPGERPDDLGGGRQRPTGAPVGAPTDTPLGAPAGGPGAGGNVLVDRFMADDDFAPLYDAALVELTETLFTDGTAEAIVASWVEVLSTQDVVDAAIVESDAAAVLQAMATT